MSSTIYDIAKKSRVGLGTVSRVLNNSSSVSDATRKRVQRVMEQLNYKPHPFAIGLARQRTNSILFTIPFFTTIFFLEILRGVQKQLMDTDTNLILLGINHPDQLTDALRHSIHRHRVDGIIICSMQIPDQLAKKSLLTKLPTVLVDTYHKNYDSIVVDNVQGGYDATKHLIDLGHTRIAMLNANLRSVPAKERFKGFQHAMRDAHLPIDSQFVLKTKSKSLDGFTRETGYEMMKELLTMGKKRPTAVFVASDIQAYGALAAMGEQGLRCPNDLAVIGFDDLELSAPLGLSTMLQPTSEMGTLVIQRLLERMKKNNLPLYQKTIEPTLMIRRTTLSARKI